MGEFIKNQDGAGIPVTREQRINFENLIDAGIPEAVNKFLGEFVNSREWRPCDDYSLNVSFGDDFGCEVLSLNEKSTQLRKDENIDMVLINGQQFSREKVPFALGQIFREPIKINGAAYKNYMVRNTCGIEEEIKRLRENPHKVKP